MGARQGMEGNMHSVQNTIIRLLLDRIFDISLRIGTTGAAVTASNTTSTYSSSTAVLY